MTTRWHFDRTGFPYLALPSGDIAVSLWPVTKTQLELWLADPAGPGDDWYTQTLQLSPRVNWRSSDSSPLWGCLATGLMPNDFQRFLAWLGPQYRFPDATEWRLADRTISQLRSSDSQELRKLLESQSSPVVARLATRLAELGRDTWPRFSFLHDGILEWVTRPHGEPGGLGRPMPELPIQLILDPQAFDPVTLLKHERHPAFGLRVVRSLKSGAKR
jgi:hypothetical protein